MGKRWLVGGDTSLTDLLDEVSVLSRRPDCLLLLLRIGGQ